MTLSNPRVCCLRQPALSILEDGVGGWGFAHTIWRLLSFVSVRTIKGRSIDPPYPRVHPRCSRSANSWLYKHQSICSCEHLGGEMEKKFSGPSHHCCCCKVRNLQGLEMITVNMCKSIGHVLEDTPGLPQGLPAVSCCNYCRARGHLAEVCK